MKVEEPGHRWQPGLDGSLQYQDARSLAQVCAGSSFSSGAGPLISKGLSAKVWLQGGSQEYLTTSFLSLSTASGGQSDLCVHSMCPNWFSW